MRTRRVRAAPQAPQADFLSAPKGKARPRAAAIPPSPPVFVRSASACAKRLRRDMAENEDCPAQCVRACEEVRSGAAVHATNYAWHAS